MARVTVEDCVKRVSNRFDLVVLAAQRVKEILMGAPLTIDRDKDKNAVIALREIAEKTVDTGALREGIIRGYQSHTYLDEEEKGIADILAEETENIVDTAELTIQDSVDGES